MKVYKMFFLFLKEISYKKYLKFSSSYLKYEINVRNSEHYLLYRMGFVS